MNTVKQLRLCMRGFAHLLLIVGMISSLSLAADRGKNGKIAFQANYTGSCANLHRQS